MIRAALLDLRQTASIASIGFDPWHSDQLIVQLTMEDGFQADQVVDVAQTYAGMSSGCLALEAAVLAGEVDAQGDPLLTWSVGNAVIQSDNKSNIYPVKKRSRGRIDPLMALAMAFSLAVRPAPPVPSYDIYLL